MAAYHVVWECVVEQWLGVRRTVYTASHVNAAGFILDKESDPSNSKSRAQ